MPIADGRDGVALILVLSFLAILVILSVTFSIAMRTDRLVSRQYLEQTRSEALLEAALARALAEIESRVVDLPYPDRIVFASTGEAGPFDDTLWDTGIIPDAVRESNLDHLSSLYWQEPEDSGWIDLGQGTDGRVAFYAIDCSGFIDPHLLMEEVRRSGVSPAELHPTSTVLSDTNLPHRIRSEWIRLFDQQELREANQGVNLDFLFPFSYAPNDMRVIPVVLDQTRDGTYTYLGADGQTNTIDITTNTHYDPSFPRPDWIDAHEYGRTLPTYDGAPILARLITNHLERMFAETPALPPTEFVHLADAIAEYNEGRGHARMDQVRFPNQSFRPKHFYFNARPLGHAQYGGVAGGLSNPNDTVGYSKNLIFPSPRPAPLPVRTWARADELSRSTNGVLRSRVGVEVHFELVNPYPVPLDLTGKLIYLPFRMTPIREAPSLDADIVLAFPQGRVTGWQTDVTASSQTRNMGIMLDDEIDGRRGGYRVSVHRNTVPSLAVAFGTDRMAPGATHFLRYQLEFDFEFAIPVPPHANLPELYIRGFGLDIPALNLHRYLHAQYESLGGGDIQARRLCQFNTDGSFQGFRRQWTTDDPRVLLAGAQLANVEFNAGATPPALRTVSQIKAETSAASAPDGTADLFYGLLGAAASPNEADPYARLDSLAALGRLPIYRDQHWHTMPLVGTDARDVAKYFSVFPEWPSVKGRININSPYADVIASGFLEANTDMKGNHLVRDPLSIGDADRLARLILRHRPAGGYTNVIDVWRAAPRSEWANELGGRNKFEVEEIVMRSERLFTTRQQIFTLVLAAQINPSGDHATAETQAVAVVWRDPFRTDADGRILEPNDPGYAAGRHRIELLSFRKLDQ